METNFFYANGLEMSVSAYDLSFKFLRNAPSGKEKSSFGAFSEEDVKTEAAAVVSMSPSHAKAMLPGVFRLIQEYEKNFGVIPLPPEVAENWDALFNK